MNEDFKQKVEDLSRHIETLEEINEGLRSSFEELSALYRLSETIASAHTFSRVISLLLDVVSEVVDYDAAMLLLYDERWPSTRACAGAGFLAGLAVAIDYAVLPVALCLTVLALVRVKFIVQHPRTAIM